MLEGEDVSGVEWLRVKVIVEWCGREEGEDDSVV